MHKTSPHPSLPGITQFIGRFVLVAFVCGVYIPPPLAFAQSTPQTKPQKAAPTAKIQGPTSRPTSQPHTRTKPQSRGAASNKTPQKEPSGAELDALRNAFSSDAAKKASTPSATPASTPSAPRTNVVQRLLNAMNPAISALGIFAAGWSSIPGGGHCHADGVCHGEVGIFGHAHNPARTGLNLQQIELAFQAAVDPYFAAVVILSIAEGPTIAELEIEEAYLTTTTLPWRFQLKAGKFLSDLTRLGSRHLHDQDFATLSAPLMLGVGGETMHYAAQLTWLAPLPFFLRLGAEISYGGSITFPIADPSIPVFIGHLRSYFDLTPSVRLLLGAGVAYGIWDRTLAEAADLSRFITTAHLLLQWRPPQRNNNLAFKLVAEYYGNWSQCDPRKTDASTPQTQQYCAGTNPEQITTQALHGISTKAVMRFSQQWHAGARFEWMQQRQPSAQRPTHRLSAMLLFAPTEFSRIRLEFNGSNLFDNHENAYAVWLQFQFSIGAHGAHSF